MYFGFLDLDAPELIIILLILLLLFGGKKLPELSKSIGESIRELKKGIGDSTGTPNTDQKQKSAPSPQPDEHKKP